MTDSSLHQSSQFRNRRLLITAAKRGQRVLAYWGGRYTVLGSDGKRQHECHTWIDADGNRHEYCDLHCQWYATHGEVVRYNAGTPQSHEIGQPCAHILLMRWHRLSAGAKAIRLSRDTELAAVLGPRLPVVVPFCLGVPR